MGELNKSVARCPECGGTVKRRLGRRECSECGFVVRDEEPRIDSKPASAGNLPENAVDRHADSPLGFDPASLQRKGTVSWAVLYFVTLLLNLYTAAMYPWGEVGVPFEPSTGTTALVEVIVTVIVGLALGLRIAWLKIYVSIGCYVLGAIGLTFVIFTQEDTPAFVPYEFELEFVLLWLLVALNVVTVLWLSKILYRDVQGSQSG